MTSSKNLATFSQKNMELFTNLEYAPDTMNF
jgi:hypothetical protein